MPRNKFDGVIEAVRYLPDGKVEVVRLYERRGAVWSDLILLQRSELVKRIEAGGTYVTGKRKAYFGSQFETGNAVKLHNGSFSSGGESGTNDRMGGVSIF